MDIKSLFTREQGWCSSESTHLPSMWPGFKSRHQRHMWVAIICLLVLSFAPRGFSPGTPVFPPHQKPTLPNSNFSSNHQVDEAPLNGSATSKFCYCSFIYLFIHRVLRALPLNYLYTLLGSPSPF